MQRPRRAHRTEQSPQEPEPFCSRLCVAWRAASPPQLPRGCTRCVLCAGGAACSAFLIWQAALLNLSSTANAQELAAAGTAEIGSVISILGSCGEYTVWSPTLHTTFSSQVISAVAAAVPGASDAEGSPVEALTSSVIAAGADVMLTALTALTSNATNASNASAGNVTVLLAVATTSLHPKR